MRHSYPTRLFSMRGRQNGFTLIELLVVIAIIGILAAMIFPAFQTMRKNAQMVRCTANLKQIGLAVQTYHENYRRFPEGTGAAFLGKLYVSGELQENRLFHCPGDPVDDESGAKLAAAAKGSGGLNGDSDGTTYSARDNTKGGQHELRGSKVLNLSSRVPIVADEDDDNHGDDRIFLFLDGHAEKVRKRDPKFQTLTQPLAY